MTCPHCGTLNPGDGDACASCRRPLAPRSRTCYQHPERGAVSSCGRCDRHLCEECRVFVTGAIYCAEHAREILRGADDPMNMVVVNPDEAMPATFGQRVQSAVVDALIYAAYLVIVYIAMWALIGSPPSHPDAGGWRALFWMLAILMPAGYLLYGNASGGRTLGKEACGLLAVRDDGTMMDINTAAVRALLSILGLLAGGVGFWAILWDSRSRALHDVWTRTIVVQD